MRTITGWMAFSTQKVEGFRPMPPTPDANRRARQTGPAGADFTRDLAQAGASQAPPPEVSAEVRAAARAATRLHELGRELSFRQSANGNLLVELRDLDGNVLRTVAPTEVFDFAEGRVTS
jgi:flagellar protein FlaG